MQLSFAGQLGLLVGGLFCRGEVWGTQKEADLFKRGMLRQFVDVNAAIGKDSLVAVDVTNARRCSDYALKSFGGRRRCRWCCSGWHLNQTPNFMIAGKG